MIVDAPKIQSGKKICANGLTGRLSEAALGYQRMLEQNPCRPDALVGISLVALASRQHDAAVKMAEAAVAAAPEMVVAWVALGHALKADGRGEEAEQAYKEAISRDSGNAMARMGLGELKISTGRAEEAAREFERALRQKPSLAAAHLGLGNAYAFMGRNEEALDCYNRTLALQSRFQRPTLQPDLCWPGWED